ncbi:MAG: hypothetical protein ACM65L_16480 [Microcoleus sp.]
MVGWKSKIVARMLLPYRSIGIRSIAHPSKNHIAPPSKNPIAHPSKNHIAHPSKNHIAPPSKNPIAHPPKNPKTPAVETAATQTKPADAG